MTSSQLKEMLYGYWSQRDARERKILSIGGAVVAAILLYSVAVAPAYFGTNRLQKDLPQLRQQALSLEALARQARMLNVNPNNATTATLSTQESIETALGRRGMKAQNIVVTTDQVRVQLNNVSFANLIEWIDEMQKSARLSMVDGNFTAQTKVDIVNATLNLRQPKTDAS